jgi:hypothetical protein
VFVGVGVTVGVSMIVGVSVGVAVAGTAQLPPLSPPGTQLAAGLK